MNRDNDDRTNGSQNQMDQGIAETRDSSSRRKPDYLAYMVKEYGDDQSVWTRTGAAFGHRDGLGMDVVFDAVPLNGRLTLREPYPDNDERERGRNGENSDMRNKNTDRDGSRGNAVRDSRAR